jgi:hypothetical protein
MYVKYIMLVTYLNFMVDYLQYTHATYLPIPTFLPTYVNVL